jgi:large subunit ribosomal protein L6
MKVETLQEKVEFPQEVTAEIDKDLIKLSGPKGQNQRRLASKKIAIKLEGNNIILSAKKATKKEGRMMQTFKAHIKNLIRGVMGGHLYKLKICSGHFPMSVNVSGDEFIIKNFMGENVPRTLKIKENVSVKVEGDQVIVESIDKEKAGQTAADIEQLTRVTNKDLRIFQDGIYITFKDGKEIG